MQTNTCFRNVVVAILLSNVALLPTAAKQYNAAHDTAITSTSRAPLDILYCSASDFKTTNGRKTVFKYLIRSGDMVMAGWHVKGTGHSYEETPNIQLLKSKLTNAATVWPAQIYIGNMILKKKEMTKIRNFIDRDTTMKWVLFVPMPDTSYPGHVVYDIQLTPDNPATTTKDVEISANQTEEENGVSPTDTKDIRTLSITLTNVQANPSPPRQYSKL